MRGGFHLEFAKRFPPDVSDVLPSVVHGATDPTRVPLCVWDRAHRVERGGNLGRRQPLLGQGEVIRRRPVFRRELQRVRESVSVTFWFGGREGRGFPPLPRVRT